MIPLNTDRNAPWKNRFRSWQVASASIAHNEPSKGLLSTNKSGVFQLYRWHVDTGETKQLTFHDNGKPMGFLSPDARFVYYFEDEAGNEIGHLVRIPFDGGEAQDLMEEMQPFSLGGFSISADCSTIGFIQSTRDGFKVFAARITDERLPNWTEICHLTALSNGPILSCDGNLAMMATAEHSGTIDQSILVVDTNTATKVAELIDEDASISAARFSSVVGDNRILATTTKSGFQRPLIWDPFSNERRDFELPDFDGDLIPTGWRRDALKVMLLHLTQAESRNYLLDIDSGDVDLFPMPGGTVLGAYFDSNDDVIATTQSSEFPTRVYRIREDQDPVIIAESAATAAGTKRQSIHYESADGVAIQAWLCVPEGKGPFPTILETHGGPSGVATDNWSPMAQAWIDHGFAFLTINYRGSITFGREFEKAIQGNLGTPEVEDMVYARNWLVNKGIADPGKILLTGWSYGGYLTLQTIGREPDLWAGGMAGIAIADWRLMYEDQNENLRQYQKGLFEGSPDEEPEQHAISSPITYVESIKAPLLIIQGRNDTRCPSRQMEAYLQKMDEYQKLYQIIWFEAGHGSYSTEQNIDHQEAMLKFAYRVLDPDQ